MSDIYNFFMILFGFILLDIAWARYTMFIAEKNALFSAYYAAIIPIISGVLTIRFIDNHLNLIPMAIGGFIGTYLTVKGVIK